MATPAKDMYIYHLPHTERMNLCKILDQNNMWEELGCTHMKFDLLTVQGLRREIIRGNSPSDVLLTMWGHQNHTVLELFILLSRMKHYQAMLVLKNLVEPKYHRLIKDGTQNLNQMMQDLSVSFTLNEQKDQQKGTRANLDRGSEKNLIPTHKTINVNPVQEQNPIIPKIEINRNRPVMESNENNESYQAGQRHVVKPKSPLLHLDRLGGTRVLNTSDISCVAGSAGAIPQITYEELQQSTDSWSSANILGKGGFGTVFKGTWKCTKVAIKRIERKDDQPEAYNEQVRQSITELHCLNAYRHDNVLPLYGYSIGGPQPCLVYQFMSGGCLDKRLRIRDHDKVLTWPSRLNIAIGTARGLQFLHTIGYKPLIHGDIKPANILLDHNDQPRIGDFGLAREGPHSEYTHMTVSRIHGTRPYLPDEFLRAKKFSTKIDTYSFGIVLFEIGTSLHAYSDQRDKDNKFLKDYIVNYEGNLLELKDKRAEGGENVYRGLMEIGKLCVNKKSKDRPEMVAVLIQLEGVAI